MRERSSADPAEPVGDRPREQTRRTAERQSLVGLADGVTLPPAALQRLAGNGAVTRLLASSARAGRIPVQRVVSASATYVPQAAALAAITLLDGQIAAAEQDAAHHIQHPAGGIHTARQANYLRHPNPMTWGYCVEEQLDPRATGLGWNTQLPLGGSRPDYYRTVGPAYVFADLTTAGQANPAGNHITTKLVIAAHLYDTTHWQAADVIHTGQRPGGAAPPPIQTNGPVTPLHARRFQEYQAYLRGETGYDELLHQIQQTYGNVTGGTFTQTWDANRRDRFVAAFDQDPDTSESDYSMDTDEESS